MYQIFVARKGVEVWINILVLYGGEYFEDGHSPLKEIYHTKHKILEFYSLIVGNLGRATFSVNVIRVWICAATYFNSNLSYSS